MSIRIRGSFPRLLTAVAAGVMTFILLGASPATAHVVAEGLFTYRSNDNCVYQRSEISDGDGGGYLRADTHSDSWLSLWPTGFQCANGYERPAGYIAVKIQVMAWTGSASGWFLCAETDWHYNSSIAQVFAIESRMIGRPLCGSALYGTMATGYVWHHDAWYGGGLFSGEHLLPSTGSLSAMEAPTDYPEPGDTVGVLDASGNPVLDEDGAPVTAVLGEVPFSAPGTDEGVAGDSVVTEDGVEVSEVPLHPASEQNTF